MNKALACEYQNRGFDSNCFVMEAPSDIPCCAIMVCFPPGNQAHYVVHRQHATGMMPELLDIDNMCEHTQEHMQTYVADSLH